MGKYESWNAYLKEYNKENIKSVSFKLHKENDAEIIEYLEKSSNKSALIKKLLKEDLERKK